MVAYEIIWTLTTENFYVRIVCVIYNILKLRYHSSGTGLLWLYLLVQFAADLKIYVETTRYLLHTYI